MDSNKMFKKVFYYKKIFNVTYRIVLKSLICYIIIKLKILESVLNLSSFNKKRGLKKWVLWYAKHVILLLIILKMKKLQCSILKVIAAKTTNTTKKYNKKDSITGIPFC
jgi:hypothetical protein